MLKYSPTSTTGLALPSPACNGTSPEAARTSYPSLASSSLMVLKWARGGLRPRTPSNLDTDAEDSSLKSPSDENHNVSTTKSSPSIQRSFTRRYIRCPYSFIVVLIVVIVVFHCVLLVFMPSGDTISENLRHGNEPIKGSLSMFRITDIHTLRLNPEEIVVGSDCEHGHQSCLVTLGVDHIQPDVSLPPVLRQTVFSAHLSSEINYMPGFINSLHMDIITVFTDMQWSHNIYGSLGEISAHLGKFTSVLAFNYDQEAGERLFVVDNFSETLLSQTTDAETRLAHLFSLLRRRGFTFNTLDATLKQIFIQDTPYLTIGESLLRNLNIPQFRMFSIGALVNPSELVTIVNQCVRVMRDGGIVIIDGVHLSKTKSRITAIIGKFIRTNPSLDFTPLLVAKNKLYLCNTRWRSVYSKYLLSNQDILQKLRIQGTTNALFGVQYTYFTIE